MRRMQLRWRLSSSRPSRCRPAASRQPAVVARPAPPQDGDDEPEAEQDAAIVQQQQLQLQRMKQMQAGLPVPLRTPGLRRAADEDCGSSRGRDRPGAIGSTISGSPAGSPMASGRNSARPATATSSGSSIGSPRPRRGWPRLTISVPSPGWSRRPRRPRRGTGPRCGRSKGRSSPRRSIGRSPKSSAPSMANEDRDRLAFRLRADVRWTTVLLARSLGLKDDQRRRLEVPAARARPSPPRSSRHPTM